MRSMNALISSRTRRWCGNASSSLVAPFASRGGSSKPTWITRVRAGNTGHASCAASHTVTTYSNSTPRSVGRLLEWPETSTPTSAVARIAGGFVPCGFLPAENASIAPVFSDLAHPSAIWLRHELPVHRISTRGLRSALVTAASRACAGRVRGAALFDRIGEPTEGSAELAVLDRVRDLPSNLAVLENPRTRQQLQVAGHHREIHGATHGNLAHRARPAALGNPSHWIPTRSAQDTPEHPRRIADVHRVRRIRGARKGPRNPTHAHAGACERANGRNRT